MWHTHFFASRFIVNGPFLILFQEILVNINAQVAEKEREIRLLEIYHKIDAKSSAMFNDQKFKKSDFFSRSRKLK